MSLCFDDFVKGLKLPTLVIPAEAGIQFKQMKIHWTPVSTGMTTFYEILRLSPLKN
jgi:hypothetical protein